MDASTYLDHARRARVNPAVYWLLRSIFQPFFHVWFRMQRIGRHHVPRTGPLILASNHRSFLDPFLIGMLTRRPVHYMAKEELFTDRFRNWWLSRIGAFPIRRGIGDEESMDVARAILEQGGCVLMFPEGTRRRRGPLGRPHRGMARLALQTGAPVVPVAVFGTDQVRRGWRVRPRRIRVRAGAPMLFRRVEDPTPAMARAVSDRVWQSVNLQWEWLGGDAAPRAETVRRPIGAPPIARMPRREPEPVASAQPVASESTI